MCKQIAFSIFPGGPTGKEPKGMRCSFNPQVGKIAGEENGRLLQYSSLESSMDFFFPGGLQPMGLQRVRYNRALTRTHLAFENKSPCKLMTDIYTDIVLIRIQV